jgi:hypothetical protein
MQTIISRPARQLPSDSVVRGRLARLDRLTPDQVEAALVFLAGCDNGTFNAIVEAAETWDDAAPRGAVLVSPAQRAGTGGGVLGSDGLPGSVR